MSLARIASSIAVLLAAAAPAFAGEAVPTMSSAQIGLDRSFGNGGSVLTRTGSVVPGFNDNFAISATVAIADRRGRVVVGADAPTHGLLVRYRRDGSLDAGFGRAGVATDARLPDGPVGALAVDWEGRLVAVFGDKQDLVVARYLGDGSLDRSFAGEGIVLARLTDDGALDESFGNSGVFTAKLEHGNPFQLIHTSTSGTDARVIVVATTFAPLKEHQRPAELKRFQVFRLLPDGGLDPTFGGGDGVVQFAVGPYGTTASVVELDSGGRIVIGGVNGRGFGFARLRPDGRRDAGFGSYGRVVLRAAGRFADSDFVDTAASSTC